MKKYNLKKKGGFFSILIKRLFQKKPKKKEELLTLIKDSEKHKLIDKNTSNMLEGVMNITKKTIKEIMIPQPKMITIKINYSLKQCLDVIIKSAHSRFPIISDDDNFVKGFLIAKDLLPFMKNSSEKFFINKIVRPPIIVPESKYVDNMLTEFRINRYHMAIVMNEFGYVSGLVTIEDILELIVGDIEDEYDNKDENNIQKINHNTFLVKALTPIKEFNIFFNTYFKNEAVDTIGGLIMQKFQHLPKIKEKINLKQHIFEIYKINNRRIIQLKVTILKTKL